ncbi:RDD family protein [Nocardia sp. NBC_01388]|uniref:RDD family protein n=1 Tax=Nocardia sp. NBC_01388 TaxID=2903596 RepID=UPI003252D10A
MTVESRNPDEVTDDVIPPAGADDIQDVESRQGAPAEAEQEAPAEAESGPADTDSASVEQTDEGAERASWRARVFAYTVDVLCPLVSLAVLGLIVADAPQNLWLRSGSGVAAAAIIGFVAWNTVYRQGKSGRTIGKAIVGVRTIRCGAENELGVARALWREVAHVVDTVPLLAGWLWPLRDRRGQSFADKLADTMVIPDGDPSSADSSPLSAKRIALGTFAMLAAVLVSLAATQYFHDYRRDRDTAEITRGAQDLAQKSTVALLTYQAATVDQELAAASSKLTGSFKDYYDSYTKTVVAPAAHEKTVNTQAQCAGSALISADDRHATVLVFINQSTTTAENPQPSQISSTVRVQLTKIGPEWLISEFEPI